MESCEHNNKCLSCGNCATCGIFKPCPSPIHPDGKSHYTADDIEAENIVKRHKRSNMKCPYCHNGRWKRNGVEEQCKNCRGTTIVKKDVE